MAGVLDLFGKIVIDTRSVEQTIDTLHNLAAVIGEVGDLTDDQSKQIKKSIDKQADSFDKLADDVKKANDAKEAAARIEQVMNNNITKATSTIANYVATVKRAAVSEAEKTKLIAEAVGTLNSYEASLKNGDKSSLAFATANTQLAATVGQLSRDLRVATTSLGDQQTLSVATIRSIGQLESVFLRTTAAVKQSSMAEQDKIKQLNDLQAKYTEAKVALQTYGTGNAKAALQQVDFRKQVALTRTEVDKVNQATRARELENWRNQMTNLTKSVQLALGPLSGIASRITALSGLFNRNGAALAATFASLTAFTVLLSSSASAAVETERQMVGLQSRIEVLGLAAETSGQKFNEMAHRLAASTLSSASAVREAQGALLEFGNIGVGSFERVITAAIGMQSTFGGGLNEQIAKLGRILDDPIKNFDALTRRGITFNEEERKKITLLQRSGQLFEAQQIILQKFNGFTTKAQEESKTLAGALDTVSGNLDLLREKLFVGSGASKEATDRVNAFAKAIQDFTNSGAAETLGEAFVTTIKAVGNSILFLSNNMDKILPAIAAISAALATNATVSFIKWLGSITGVTKAVVASTAAIRAHNAATESSVVSTLKAARAKAALRLAALGVTGAILTITTAYVAARYAQNQFNQLSKTAFSDNAVVNYRNQLEQTTNAQERMIKQEQLQARKAESDKALAERLGQLAELEAKLKTIAPQNKEYADAVWAGVTPSKELIDAENERMSSLQGIQREMNRLKPIVTALKVENAALEAQVKAGTQANIDYQNAQAKYSVTNAAEFINQMSESLENESRAIKKVVDDLNTMEESRKAAEQVLISGTETEKKAAAENIKNLDRLLPLQRQQLDLMQRTTVQARQRNAENNLVDKFRNDMQNINAELVAYELHSGNAVKLNEALFSIEIRKNAESLRREIEAVANTSEKPTEFYKRLAATMKGNVLPNAEAIANAMAAQNAELKIANENAELIRKNEEARINLMPMMKGIEERYKLQAQAVSLLKDEEKKEYLAWLEIQKNKEMMQAEMAKKQLEAGLNNGFGTDAERRELELIAIQDEMNQKIELAKQFYAHDQQLLEAHVAKIKKIYEDKQDMAVTLSNLDKAVLVTERGMGMMEALNKKNGNAYKAFAISNIMISQGMLIAKTLQEYGPILGPVLAGMMAVQTGAQIAKVKAQQFATGGYVSGAGTGTSDSIPALLSNGEYVIKASAVQRMGVGALDMINSGKLPAFNLGGSVGVIAANNPSNSSSNVEVNIIDQRSQGGEIVREESVGSDGQRQLKIFIRDAINESIRSGSLDGTMSSVYGLSRQGIRR